VLSPREYHDGTKHHFHRYARSLGYLDWASQPNPFRTYAGAPLIPLYPSPAAGLRTGNAANPSVAGNLPTALDAPALGDLLRHALGLSAWKEFKASRWSLRVNPSSGNLHPTEAYVISGPLDGACETAAVYHYAADRHALERRCAFDAAAWTSYAGGAVKSANVALVALTSIHWRESWKYGERAFRYCQHDMGHAVASVAIAAALLGWRAALLPGWPHDAIGALCGLDRDDDFFEAEREEPGCVLAVAAGEAPDAFGAADPALVDAVRGGAWTGRANQLSEDHVEWSFIEEIASATRDREGFTRPAPPAPPARPAPPAPYSRALILQRRSALAFDGRSTLPADMFFAMLARAMPSAGVPFDALWWTPCVHLALFVHRIEGLSPGLYLLARRDDADGVLRAALVRDFLWERVHHDLPLFCLARGDCRSLAARLSCDQDIAADGFFSFGMLAEFDAPIDRHGGRFYRHLFWETGVIGQVMYLEAEAAGARATGIGCFFDEPVHEVLGVRNHILQSLYHFTVGMPVEDVRLQSASGYEWEAPRPAHP
jgi:SagB-type dehydrogenase family enzyme